MPTVLGTRKNCETAASKRGPETPEEAQIRIKCSICGHERMDKAPEYEVCSGKYIARRQTCPDCPKKKDGKTGQKAFVPVDSSIPMVSAKIANREAKKEGQGHAKRQKV